MKTSDQTFERISIEKETDGFVTLSHSHRCLTTKRRRRGCMSRVTAVKLLRRCSLWLASFSRKSARSYGLKITAVSYSSRLQVAAVKTLPDLTVMLLLAWRAGIRRPCCWLSPFRPNRSDCK